VQGRVTGVVVVALALGACDGQRLAATDDLGGDDLSAANLCPDDQPDTCPSPAPSWQHQVAALIQTHCASCHSPNGEAFDHLLETYAEVYSQRGLVLDQVNACNMPPGDAGLPMPETDRKTIVTWFVCGAPNN